MKPRRKSEQLERELRAIDPQYDERFVLKIVRAAAQSSSVPVYYAWYEDRKTGESLGHPSEATLE